MARESKLFTSIVQSKSKGRVLCKIKTVIEDFLRTFQYLVLGYQSLLPCLFKEIILTFYIKQCFLYILQRLSFLLGAQTQRIWLYFFFYDSFSMYIIINQYFFNYIDIQQNNYNIFTTPQMSLQLNWQNRSFPFSTIQFQQNKNSPATYFEQQSIREYPDIPSNESSIPSRLSEDPHINIQKEYRDYKLNREKYIQTLITQLKIYEEKLTSTKNQLSDLLIKNKAQIQQIQQKHKVVINDLNMKIRDYQSERQKSKQLVQQIDQIMKECNFLKRQLNRTQKDLKNAQDSVILKQTQNIQLTNEINQLKDIYIKLLNKVQTKHNQPFDYEDLKILPVKCQDGQDNIGSPEVFSYSHKRKSQLILSNEKDNERDSFQGKKKSGLSIKLIPIQNNIDSGKNSQKRQQVSADMQNKLKIVSQELQKVIGLNKTLLEQLNQQTKKRLDYQKQRQKVKNQYQKQFKIIRHLQNRIQQQELKNQPKQGLDIIESRQLDQIFAENSKYTIVNQLKVDNKIIFKKYQHYIIRQKHRISQFCLKANLLIQQLINSIQHKSSELERFMLQQLKQTFSRFNTISKIQSI